MMHRANAAGAESGACPFVTKGSSRIYDTKYTSSMLLYQVFILYLYFLYEIKIDLSLESLHNLFIFGG